MNVAESVPLSVRPAATPRAFGRLAFVVLIAAAVLTHALPRDIALPVRAAILAAPLLALAWIDLRTRLLPNRLVALFAAVSAVTAPLAGDPSVIGAVAGGAVGFGAMLVLFVVLRGFGAGDVKLAGAVGLAVGLGALGSWAVLSCLAAGLVAVGLLVTRRARRGDAMALGPALVFGALIVLASQTVDAL